MLLGTAGGPLPSPFRSGISQAVVVGGRVHLIDCGGGVTRQLRTARLLKGLHRVYLTHLHSDHDCDYFNLFLLGWPILQWNPPVHIYGPGPAGGLRSLPPDEGGGPRPPVINSSDPTPGLIGVTEHQVRAHAYDLNIRMREAGRSDLTALMVPHEIGLPPGLGAHGPDVVAPAMDPLLVAEDDDMRVTAVLAQHAPVFPAFAFRFDTARGSIVISGDTAPCPNLITLARGADVLVHEVFDDQTLDQWPEGEEAPILPGAASRAAREEDAESIRREHHLVTSHTALSQVGKVATAAGVGKLVLTHFVPGDDDKPDQHWIKGASADFDGEVIVGSDLLELSL